MIELGDVDDPTPRTQWRMGKVLNLVKGHDDEVCGAKLKVLSKAGKQTYLFRPIQRLIPFEIVETSRNDRRDDNSEGDLNETIVELPEIENSDENRKQRNDGRVRRKRAIEGQNLRRAREQYY
jgi:hypothetical protein